ncbi:MAG: DinB family protein [Pseudomonadota bacterium]
MITNQYVYEMATYSRWQNDNVYEHCEQIGPEERKRDSGMFFGSIHNTLDHICVVNRSILTFINGTMPERIPPGRTVWPDWEELKSVRLEQDNLLSRGAHEWTEGWMAGKTTKTAPEVDDLPAIPRWVMIVQFFNHQTHHRSQATSALHSMGIDYGATDIPWRPRAGYFAG